MSISIWLLPCAQSGLDDAVHRYAAAHGKAVFPAHLTLASSPQAAEPDPTHLCARGALTLTRDGLLETALFTRSFALRYAASSALLDLADAARQALGGGQDALPFVPHVSLTYGPADDRAALVAIAEAYNGPLLFDRICIVQTIGSATQADVAGWRVGTSRALTGTS